MLAWAVDELRARFGPLRVAPLYRTEPISDIIQDPFLNTVLIGRLDRIPTLQSAHDGTLSLEKAARRVVAVAKELEAAAGRRPGPKDGPRPLDVDLLFLGIGQGHFAARDDEPASTSEWPGAVSIPHPRMGERRFVLAPLADLAPRLRWVHEGVDLSIGQMLDACAHQEVEQVPWTMEREMSQ